MSKGLVTSGGRGQGTRTPLNDRVGEGGGVVCFECEDFKTHSI